MTFEEKMKQYAAEHIGLCRETDTLDVSLYDKLGVKRGLRDKSGKGVVAGITHISKIVSKEVVDGEEKPCEGQLFYRGYNIYDIVGGLNRNKCDGFEEASYLLLFGKLPDKAQLKEYKKIVARNRRLPTNFVRDVIMKAPSKDIMNSLTRSVLTLASYDKNISDMSPENVLIQCINLIGVFPLLAVYAYHAYNHYELNDSLYIHRPDDNLSTAENMLRILRPDMQYSELEAKVLDLALILHMEHGGGNNSTFTTRVVTSSGSDTYSVIAAALSSLKGPKHGGANIKVVEMMEDIFANLSDEPDEQEIKDYLRKILHKEAFDRAGLIYGMGHAVYSKSDPRAETLKVYVGRLAKEKVKKKNLLCILLLKNLHR